MKSLSEFVKDEFVKNELLKDCMYIESTEQVDKVVEMLSCGHYININFKNTILKNYFIDCITTVRPESNIINCNCSLDCYNDNDFSGFLIFNNVKRCKHNDIIEDIKKYKSIILC